MTGSEFASQIMSLAGQAREQAVVDAIFSGNIPEFLKSNWPEIVITHDAHELRCRVSPDWSSVGDSRDFLYTPQWPTFAQTVADAFHCILPSTKLVAEITKQALVKIPLQIPPLARPVSPRMETTAAWVQVSDQIKLELYKQPNYRPGVLVAGGKKDVVVGPGLDGSHVAIFGGLHDDLHSFWQPYSIIHPWNYSDYSHGIRLVHRDAILDGKPMDLVGIFQSPSLSSLVSSQGPFTPIFPMSPATISSIHKQTIFPSYALASNLGKASRDHVSTLLTLGLVVGGAATAWYFGKKFFSR